MKLIGLLAVDVVAVAAPPAMWPVWAGCAAVLAGIAVAGHVPARLIWRRGRIALGAVLLAAATIPFVRHGGAEWGIGPLTASEAGLTTFAGVAAKATIGTVAAVLLAATTTFPEILRALESLRVPRLLTAVAAVTYRYFDVLGDEVRRMRVALSARGHRPRTLLQAGGAGRVAAALFLRAHARGERVHLAMLARGYGADR